jgi:hypothetical protein
MDLISRTNFKHNRAKPALGGRAGGRKKIGLFFATLRYVVVLSITGFADHAVLGRGRSETIMTAPMTINSTANAPPNDIPRAMSSTPHTMAVRPAIVVEATGGMPYNKRTAFTPNRTNPVPTALIPIVIGSTTMQIPHQISNRPHPIIAIL